MSTLILSVHAECYNHQLWRRLQKDFISKTVGDYEYGIIANGNVPIDGTVKARIGTKSSHIRGIQTAIEIFKSSTADNFVLLDSDCWPIRSDWIVIIERLLKTEYSYAAPVRTENFDLFPHPCAFFMLRSFIDHVDFGFKKMPNLLGKIVSDVGMAMPTTIDNKAVWYPLLKTNYISPHPLCASIYGDLFYHHCAGSRGAVFRSMSYGIYDHIFKQREHAALHKSLTAELRRAPTVFINKLRGKS